MSKFDTCIYAEYFGDYGMNICNHPSRSNDHAIYDGDCRKCKLHMTHSGAIKKCPFCGKSAYLSNYCGSWHITCHRCNIEMKDCKIENIIERWNKRSERKDK